MLQHHASVDRSSPGLAPASGPATPAQPPLIRQEIAELVRTDQMPLARELAQAALKAYPDHEDILVIHALVCEMQHDWNEAEKSLRLLVELQSPNVTEEAWRHWIRVLRCAGQSQQALSAAFAAVQQHPGSIILKNELEALRMPQAVNRAAA